MEGRMPEDRPHSDIAIASAKVAAIVTAAEQAADDLRARTEERARERIAEADRAADLRVEAGEAEALELVEEARSQARALEAEAKAAVAQIHSGAAAARAAADQHRESSLAEIRDETTRLRAEADSYADQIKIKAKADARATIKEAHDAARHVLHDGQQLSTDLGELSVSLHRNADRLLRDVKLAHARLVAELDQAQPAESGGSSPSSSLESPDDFDVPEFLPRP
jgi:hypothetical protein